MLGLEGFNSFFLLSLVGCKLLHELLGELIDTLDVLLLEICKPFLFSMLKDLQLRCMLKSQRFKLFSCLCHLGI